MAFTSGNDINILQGTDLTTVGAGAGNDRYVLTAATLTANQKITLSDTLGTNTLQLVGGLEIVSSKVANDAIQLTLNNGAVITVLGASTFSFQTGGDSLSGTGGVVQSFNDFVTLSLGATVPAAGAAPIDVGSVTVNPDGGTTGGGALPTYALTAAAAAVDEGATATFNLATTNVAAGTEVAYTITGIDAADLASGALTGKAVVAADGSAVISVALAADKATEGAETLTVTLDGPAISAASTVNDTSMAPTFMLTASATNDNLEGNSQSFTLTASEPVTADTVVTFSIVVGDAAAVNQGTSTTNLNDFAQGSFNPVTVTILAGQTTAQFNVSGANDNLTEVPESYSVKAVVNGETKTLAATLLDGAGTYNLIAAAEQISGTVNDDTFNGSDTTIVLDVLDGKGGTDTLNYSDATGGKDVGALGATLTSIEVINVRSTAAATADTSAMSGVTSLNATTGTSAALTAATTTDVSATGITGAVIINGGKDITVTDTATAAVDITIGATTVGAGTVTVTDSKVGAGSIAVDGGTDVTITATGSSGAADTITVGNGGATSDLPSGIVKVTSAHTGVAATDVTLNGITVKGGSTVTVTQAADTSKAAADTTGATLTQGTVTVAAGNATTAVTVSQAASTTEVLAVTAVAGVTETASVKFGALKANDILIIGGDGDATLEANELAFTATVDMTAAEVAAAFANLTNGTLPVTGDTQGSGLASKGTYTTSATTSALTGWTSGAVSTDTVVFTSTVAGAVTDLAFNLAGTGTAPTVTSTQAVAAVAAVTGVLGVITGVVTIDDNATASVTTVSVDGYGTGSKLGDTTSLTKLTTLSLANSGGATAGATDATMLVDATGVASLNLTVNKVLGNVSLDGAADSALKTLNLTTAGADSSFALTAAAVETLAISGDKKATLSSGTFTALKTLTVSGTASAVFDTDEADTLTSVNTSATTGAVTAAIDGTKATYTGGAGVDTVSLVTGTSLTKAIDLGAGDDTLSFVALNVTGSSAAVAGGDGTDTLSMATATAANLDGAIQNFYTSFERLTINDAAASATIDLANLGFTNYVTTTGSSGTLTLSNLASNGTVVLTTAPTTGYAVSVKDAATGTADVLNVVLSSAGNLAAGLLTAADVETINISTVDTEAAPQTTNVDSLTLTADKATSVVVTGGQTLTLTMTGSTKVTSIDASAATGAITVTSLNTTGATTIKGGSAGDSLTAATGTTADVLIGGAGNDKLTSNAGLSTLTGGDGADLFVINTASQNVNSYATITDFTSGDLIQMAIADNFASAKVTLGDTAVFQDYANAAMNALDASASDAAGWFQFGGNTYVVVDVQTTNSTTFVNAEDLIVKLTGLVDLSTATFNATHGTIGIA